MNSLPFVYGSLFGLLTFTACNHPEKKVETKSSQKQLPVPALQPAPAYQPTDTLFITDDFASSPFSLDSVSVPGVKDLFNPQHITRKPVKNNFVENQTDTVITFRKGKSFIQLYKVNSEENKCFYQAALIRDSIPVLSQSLRIGQTKQMVKRAIPALSRQSSLPDIIQISNTHGTDLVYLIFRNNKLAALKFEPYLD